MMEEKIADVAKKMKEQNQHDLDLFKEEMQKKAEQDAKAAA